MPASTITSHSYPGVTAGRQAKQVLSAPPGVILDSHLGWHIHYTVVDLAVSAGFPITFFERIQLDLYRDGSQELTSAQRTAAMSILDSGGLVDKAVEYLNRHIAKPPYAFGFCEGDFAYLPDTVWRAQP